MQQKESTGDAENGLGRGGGVKSRQMKCSALQISLVLSKFSFTSLWLSAGIHQVKENQRDNAGESDYVNAVEHLQQGEELLFSTSHLATAMMGALGSIQTEIQLQHNVWVILLMFLHVRSNCALHHGEMTRCEGKTFQTVALVFLRTLFYFKILYFSHSCNKLLAMLIA